MADPSWSHLSAMTWFLDSSCHKFPHIAHFLSHPNIKRPYLTYTLPAGLVNIRKTVDGDCKSKDQIWTQTWSEQLMSSRYLLRPPLYTCVNTPFQPELTCSTHPSPGMLSYFSLICSIASLLINKNLSRNVQHLKKFSVTMSLSLILIHKTKNIQSKISVGNSFVFVVAYPLSANCLLLPILMICVMCSRDMFMILICPNECMWAAC